MSTFDGRTIALLESRRSEEIATLVRRLGGVPVSAPTVAEIPRFDDFGVFIDGLSGRRFSLSIFLSGVGTTTLLAEAERRGRLTESTAVLREMTIACRGPKPLAALKQFGLRAQVTTGKPHTTRELLDALTVIEVRERGVLLVHYGERNRVIADALRARNARLDEVCPYEWGLPDDIGPIRRVVRDALAGNLDAILFTSQIQCRHLFEIAADMGATEGLTLSLGRDIVVGAVGPVCAQTLRDHGVVPDVMPASPSMPALIRALADYFELTQGPV